MFKFLMSEDQIKRYYEKKANKKIIEDNCKTEYKRVVLENKKRLIPEFLEIKSLKRQ